MFIKTNTITAATHLKMDKMIILQQQLILWWFMITILGIAIGTNNWSAIDAAAVVKKRNIPTVYSASVSDCPFTCYQTCIVGTTFAICYKPAVIIK